MGKVEASDPTVLRSYEGLIFCTAQRTVEEILRTGQRLEAEDFDDVAQVLRVKVWRALVAYSPEKAPKPRAGTTRSPRDRYVFSCVYNQAKDIIKRKRRGELLLDDIAPTEPAGNAFRQSDRNALRDRFEFAHGLAATHEQVYGAVEEEDPLIPNTLDRLELSIVCLLYRDYGQSEAARYLGVDKRTMERAMKSIREKMEDWRPESAAGAEVPLPVAA